MEGSFFNSKKRLFKSTVKHRSYENKNIELISSSYINYIF